MNRRALGALAALLAVLAPLGTACVKQAALGPATVSIPPLSVTPPASPLASTAQSPSLLPPASAAPAPSPTLSKASFLVQANAICTTMNAEQSALPAPTSNAQILQDLRQAIAIAQRAVARLRGLPEPAGDAPTLQADFARVDAFVASAQKEVDAMQAGNTAQAAQLDAQTTQLSSAANQAFNAYGMTVCGEG